MRHGIDPSEEGGRIEVRVTAAGDRINASVRDSGVGMRRSEGGPGTGLGTGLATLRERLRLAFGDRAQLRVDPVEPRGVLAEVSLPVAA